MGQVYSSLWSIPFNKLVKDADHSDGAAAHLGVFLAALILAPCRVSHFERGYREAVPGELLSWEACNNIVVLPTVITASSIAIGAEILPHIY